MRFRGRVWRHIPADGHPLDTGYILKAAGRWNRRGSYGCLYTALSRSGAEAEYQKHLERAAPGRILASRDLVAIEVDLRPVLDLTSPDIRSGVGIGLARIRGDKWQDLEACRRVADWARRKRYVAILAPSAAAESERNLAIYPDIPPAANIDLSATDERVPLNYER